MKSYQFIDTLEKGDREWLEGKGYKLDKYDPETPEMYDSLSLEIPGATTIDDVDRWEEVNLYDADGNYRIEMKSIEIWVNSNGNPVDVFRVDGNNFAARLNEWHLREEGRGIETMLPENYRPGPGLVFGKSLLVADDAVCEKIMSLY